MSSDRNKSMGEEKSPIAEYEAMLNKLVFPACIISSAGKTEIANRPLFNLFNELVGTGNFEEFDWKDLFDTKYKSIVANAFIRSINGAYSRVNIQLSPLISENNRNFEMSMQPLESEGSIMGVFIVLNGVDSMESYNPDTGIVCVTQHFEYSPMPMIRLDQDLNIVKLSESFRGTFGKVVDKEGDLHWDDISMIFKYDSEKIRNNILELFSETISYKRLGEIRVSLKEQNAGMANLTLYPIRLGKKITYVEMILEDITLLKDLKRRLENFRRMILINDIGKGFTHSINNTLNVILNQTQLLQLIAIKDPVIKGLNQIEKYAHQAVEHIKRIQLFLGDNSVVHDERIEILDTVMKDSLEFVKIHFRVSDARKKTNLVIESNEEDYEGLRVKTDTRLLRELIIWSMLRVSSYIEKNGTIKVGLLNANSYGLEFACSKRKNDKSENIVPYTIDGFSTSEIRESAEKLNIKVVEHESADNYSIDIIFPDWMIFEEKEKTIGNRESQITGKKVLIVEDEEGLRTILSNLFKKMNNRVFVTDNGGTALEELKSNSYDIVISDYDIPVYTGIELIAKVKEIDDSIVTLLMSAWELGDMSLYANIVDFFVAKPFNIEDLLGILSAKIKD